MSHVGHDAQNTKASPEIELLLSCATTVLDEERVARLRQLAQAAIDWERLLQLALRHRTMPLLYHHLNATCRDLAPPAFMDRLHDHFYLNTIRNHALNEELRGILQLLARHDIPAIPYKGPVLAFTVYGDLSLRQFNDLDILIQPQDLPRTAALLRTSGYEQQWQFTPAQQDHYLRSDCELLFSRAPDNLFLDVHWAFVRSYFPLGLDYEGIWQRLRPVSIGSVEVRHFAPEDLLTILCVHAAKDLWERLIWIVDVAELIRAEPALDWTRIVKEAHASGARRMLLLGLFLAHDLLSAGIPEEVLRQAEAEPVIKNLAAKIRARLDHDAPVSDGPLAEFLFHLQLHERIGEKCAFSFRFATTTNPADWALVGLPDQLFFLYRLIRPLRLLIKRR
jgi:Uncharacterised nucleotidyltransferase